MFIALKKIKQLLDKESQMQFGFLFVLLVIKSIFDGFGLGLIAPYILAISDASVIFENEVFKKINVYIMFLKKCVSTSDPWIYMFHNFSKVDIFVPIWS